MQYPDIGTQYRSEIFYETDTQKKEAEQIFKEKNEEFRGRIQTNISKIKNYCKAESYHQKYIEKNKR
jgi:peptide methionine sulfoxide reductase MsrA